MFCAPSVALVLEELSSPTMVPGSVKLGLPTSGLEEFTLPALAQGPEEFYAPAPAPGPEEFYAHASSLWGFCPCLPPGAHPCLGSSRLPVTALFKWWDTARFAPICNCRLLELHISVFFWWKFNELYRLNQSFMKGLEAFLLILVTT